MLYGGNRGGGSRITKTRRGLRRRPETGVVHACNYGAVQPVFETLEFPVLHARLGGGITI